MIHRPLKAALAALCLTSAVRAASPVETLKTYLGTPADTRQNLTTQPFAATPLTKAEADAAAALLRDDRLATLRAERAGEWEKRAITAADKTMRFKSKTYGTKPAAGWNLYVVLHGGGQTSAAVNDQQWSGMDTLYQPADSLVVAPRAPTDTWDLWHQPHVDVLLSRLIEDAVVVAGANPDRVYLMGYSAGGDGVYQLAPRMADRFAAAAMFAGHPNDASPLGLRNLPFALHVGALDAAYDRNTVALDWGRKLDALQTADPQGYVHQVQAHAGRGHWMNREEQSVLPWLARFTRVLLPTKVVFEQTRAAHDRSYWLALPADGVKPGRRVTATRDGQTISIDEAKDVTAVGILLNDRMLDLDRPVKVTAGGRTLFEGKPPRTIAGLARTIDGRPTDPIVFPARIDVRLTNGR